MADFFDMMQGDMETIASDAMGPCRTVTYAPKGFSGTPTECRMEVSPKMTLTLTHDGASRAGIAGATATAQKYTISVVAAINETESVAGSGVTATGRIVRMKAGDIVRIAGAKIGRPDITTAILTIGNVEHAGGYWVGEASL